MPTADVAVLGAGAAGLSFLCHLGLRSDCRNVVVVDDGRSAGTARSWSYWAAPDDRAARRIAPAVSEVRHRGHVAARSLDGRLVTSTRPLAPLEYRTVHLADLAALAHDRAPGARWVQARAVAVLPGTPQRVVLDDGTRVRAHYVLDSTGVSIPAGPMAHGRLTLAFTGAEVAVRRPCFEADVVTLFDFRTEQIPGEARFVYVLPHSPTEAFVELTRFTVRPNPDSAAERGRDLQHLLDHVETVRDGPVCLVQPMEHCALSLAVGRGAMPPPTRKHAIPIGRAAGLLKPSTGYAFRRIQEDCAALLDGSRHRSTLRHRLLDSVFLRAIADDPALLEPTFAGLVRGGDVRPLLRFLDETTTLRQEARLVSRMPVTPFLRAAGGV